MLSSTVTSEVAAAAQAQPVVKPPVTPPTTISPEWRTAVNALIQSILNFVQGLFTQCSNLRIALPGSRVNRLAPRAWQTSSVTRSLSCRSRSAWGERFGM